MNALINCTPAIVSYNMCYYNIQPPLLHELYLANGFESASSYVTYHPRYQEWVDRPLTYREWLYGDEIEFVKRHHFTSFCFLAKKIRNVEPFVRPLQGFYLRYHEEKAFQNPVSPEAVAIPKDRLAELVKGILPSTLIGPVRFLNRQRYKIKARLEKMLPHSLRCELDAWRRARYIQSLDRCRKRRIFKL